MQLKDKKVQKAWTFYDWANSVYPLVISSAIFPIFYEGYVDSKVMFFGDWWEFGDFFGSGWKILGNGDRNGKNQVEI